MGDHLRAGKLSLYVTSHPGQLSLAIPLWVGEMSTSLGWEGNHRSGVALACVTDQLYLGIKQNFICFQIATALSTYGLSGL